jgi:putative MATE family efflux protein
MAPSKIDTPTPALSSDAHPTNVPQDASRTVLRGPVRKTLLLLALPVLAEQMLNTFVGLFDTWLAGRISSAATSAVGLAAYVSWLGTMIVMLVGTGTTALVARHKGAGASEQANRCTNQSVTLAAMLGFFLFVLLYTVAPLLAAYSRLSGDAFDVAVTYLRIDSFGHIFMGLILVGCAALRGVGDMRTPMLIFAAINGVNILASCVFVYGLEMGVNGIVGGTIISRGVGAVIMLTLLIRGCAGLILIRSQLSFVWARAWRILRIGIPAATDGAVLWIGHFIFLAIIARAYDGLLGQACFAAHIIAIRVEALVYLPAVAWGAATATMIGQSLGHGDPLRAKRAGLEAVLQCGLLSVMMAAFFYMAASWIFEQMTIDPLVRAAGVGPFRVLALFQPLLIISIVLIHGLRGAGDTRVPLLITILGVLLRLSVGYYFCMIAGWGLIGAWMGMFGAMAWRATAAAAHFLSGRWITTRV